jgi:hypothetical protein
VAEPLAEPTPPETLVEAPDVADAEIARRNIVWAWSLFALFCVLFGGTIGVAYIWLWLS